MSAQTFPEEIERAAAIRGELDRGDSISQVLARHGLANEAWHQLEESTMCGLADAIDVGNPEPLDVYRKVYAKTRGTTDNPVAGEQSGETQLSDKGRDAPLPTTALASATFQLGDVHALRTSTSDLHATEEVDVRDGSPISLPFATRAAQDTSMTAVDTAANKTAEVDMAAIRASLPFQSDLGQANDAATVEVDIRALRPELPFFASGGRETIPSPEPIHSAEGLPSLDEYVDMLVSVMARGIDCLAAKGVSPSDWQRIKDAYDAKADADPELQRAIEEKLGQG